MYCVQPYAWNVELVWYPYQKLHLTLPIRIARETNLTNLFPQVLVPILSEMFVYNMFFPNLLFLFSCVIPCSHATGNFGSIKKTWAIPYFSEIWHIISWWSWWESHPCLKSYWTTYSAWAVVRFKSIYNNGKKEPCLCPCTSIPRILSLMNFSRITIAILVYVSYSAFYGYNTHT